MNNKYSYIFILLLLLILLNWKEESYQSWCLKESEGIYRWVINEWIFYPCLGQAVSPWEDIRHLTACGERVAGTGRSSFHSLVTYPSGHMCDPATDPASHRGLVATGESPVPVTQMTAARSATHRTPSHTLLSLTHSSLFSLWSTFTGRVMRPGSPTRTRSLSVQLSWSKNPIYWIVQGSCQQIPSAFGPYFMKL